MGSLTETVIELVRSHGAWVAPIVFALAFCESFAFVSLLVPATVILFGIGGMIGLSGIEYWSIWAAAAIGAIAGDRLAYVLAAKFQRQLVHVWPLSRHPELVSRGFAFFERWGIAAVFLGRFLGPLRAIVPIAAGVAQIQGHDCPAPLPKSLGDAAPARADIEHEAGIGGHLGKDPGNSLTISRRLWWYRRP